MRRSIRTSTKPCMQDDGDGEPHVDDVLRTGWKLKGRVLRPAMVKVTRKTASDRTARVVREGLLRGSRRAEDARPTRSCRARSRSSPSSTTPTRIRGTPRPRSASRRSPRRTTCSVTRRSAPSTTRSARWSRPGVGPDGAGGFGPGGFGGGGGQTFRFETDGGGLGDIFGNLFGGGGRRRARARDRSAARPRSRDRVAPAVRRRDPRRHVDGAVPRRRDVLHVRGFGRGAGHDAGDVPAVSRRGHRSPTTRARSRSRRCAPRAVGAVRSSRPRARRAAGAGVEVRAREVKVRIPAGVADGQRIRVKGRGGAGANGGPPGDLYVIVHVRGHALFGRSGNDLTLRLPVTFAEAALGADIKVPTLDAQVTVRIPPGTPSGKVLRVRGQGRRGRRQRQGRRPARHRRRAGPGQPDERAARGDRGARARCSTTIRARACSPSRREGPEESVMES